MTDFQLHAPLNIPTNQENWPSVGTIASTLAQYSAIYGNTLGQFSWFVRIGFTLLDIVMSTKYYLSQIVFMYLDNATHKFRHVSPCNYFVLLVT